MALSKKAQAYLDKVAREKAERKARTENRKARSIIHQEELRRKEAEEIAARAAAEEERRKAAHGPPLPPPEPERPYTPFPVPTWLASPASQYYRQELVDDPMFQVGFKLPDGSWHWRANAGPQTYALLCPFDEVLIGGSRGGGKSCCLIAKPAMECASLPPDDPARWSMLNDRSFRGLYLREEYQSMAEFIEEAVEFYRPFGGEPKGDPKYIQFKSGARIYFNHLQDEKAFEKYKGWNLTFIGIEELTQIRTLKQYMKLLGSLRSAPRVRVVQGSDRKLYKKTFPALPTQIFSTTNPDGPGATWVKDRFVKVPSKSGGFIPNGKVMRDTITGSLRIFIRFPLDANPTYAETTAAGRRYRSMLMGQDEVTRKQWMDGDWDAGSSLFFTEYRPEGPVGEEEKRKFPWASHRTKPVLLQSWWYRWGGADHGYDHPAAFHKACRNEHDHRVHIYDEMTMRHVGAFEQGARLAQWWLPELQALKKAGQTPCIVVHLGSDAFAKTDVEKTIAEQMQFGIREVLGPFGALLLKYDDTERDMMMKDKRRAQQMFERRVSELQGHMAIALKPSYIDRKAAWDYFREMLRFRPAVIGFQTDEERDAYLRQVLQEQGIAAYETQAANLRNLKPEILPKLMIWDHIKGLDRCLRVAQKDMRNSDDPTKPSKSDDVLKFNADQEGKNGDDELECLIAGSMVEAERGPVAIESVKVGERVWTRHGLMPVTAAGKVREDAELIRMELSNGTSLTGTVNHMIFVNGYEWKRLDSIRNGDIVLSWSKLLSSTESSSGVTLNQSADTCVTTTGQEGITGRPGLDLFIKRYGGSITAKFRLISTFTTKTKIRSTTKSIISKLSALATTFLCTLRRSQPEFECEKSKSWELRPRELASCRSGSESFTDATELGSWRKENPCRSSVDTAERQPQQRPHNSSGSATSTASSRSAEKTGSMWRSGFAQSVENLLNASVLLSNRHVPVSVVASYPAGRSAVYDLSVDRHPEYFANGILVHNSARNLVVAFKEIETTMPLSYYLNERMTQVQEEQVKEFGAEITDNTRLMMIAQRQVANFSEKQTKGGAFTIPRAGSMRHRVN